MLGVIVFSFVFTCSVKIKSLEDQFEALVMEEEQSVENYIEEKINSVKLKKKEIVLVVE